MPKLELTRLPAPSGFRKLAIGCWRNAYDPSLYGTIELVVLTLLLPLFGLGSAIYLVGAALLGLWLLAAAWKVWKQGGNKLAWKMYRYSSMYLAFIFLVLMIDRLV